MENPSSHSVGGYVPVILDKINVCFCVIPLLKFRLVTLYMYYKFVDYVIF